MKNEHKRSPKKGGTKKFTGPQENPQSTRKHAPVIGIPDARKRRQRGASNRGPDANAGDESIKNRAVTQSGDLMGVAPTGFSAGQSTAELLEEGQDLEGELVLAINSASDADEEEVPSPRSPRGRIPDYRNRNRY
ncbi:MAG: hypothetical protein WBR26_14490 [Candidatus Acidiferrum sp.]